MSKFYIRDETVHDAFEVLRQSVEAGPVARAMREKREDERRAAKAKAFLQATGNVAEREAQSLLDPSYKAACDAYYEAIQADEYWRAQVATASAITECWRTSSSNIRALGKVG
jgi:hypothetical protein